MDMDTRTAYRTTSDPDLSNLSVKTLVEARDALAAEMRTTKITTYRNNLRNRFDRCRTELAARNLLIES